MVLFRHNLPQPTQAQLMRGEFPETLCIEQGVVLSYRFAERKVRRAPRVLRMAVVSQSSVKFGKKRVLLVGATNFMTIIAEVATSKFESFCLHKYTFKPSRQVKYRQREKEQEQWIKYSKKVVKQRKKEDS